MKDMPMGGSPVRGTPESYAHEMYVYEPRSWNGQLCEARHERYTYQIHVYERYAHIKTVGWDGSVLCPRS
jgi:hypothetical protein